MADKGKDDNSVNIVDVAFYLTFPLSERGH